MLCQMARPLLLSSALLLGVLLLPGCENKQAMAQFVRVSGTVEARPGPSEKFVAVAQLDLLPPGGGVRTMPDSSADIMLAENRGIIEIKPDTYFELPTSNSNVRQNSGTAIYRINHEKGNFTIVTPHALTGVLGTVFELSVASDSTTVGVKEGKVSLTSLKGESRIIEANEKLAIDASGVFSEKTVFDLKTDSHKYIKQNEKWVPAKE
ncbi:MAG: hypothetical protein GQF41_3831 [Candidatus Rifleibacterium amylolyticum]|nr:MAG: hypothetical protein GQF41_3831 [Candidatus Rifleibacterium amylolyticum]